MNVNIEKVSETALAGYCKSRGIKVPRGITLREKVKLVETHQVETVPDDNLSEPCTVCGGESDTKLAACPFCGAAGIDGMVDGKPVEAEGHVVPDTEGPPKEAKKSRKKRSEAGPPEVESPPSTTLAADHPLEVGIARVFEAKRAGANCMWDLGRALIGIFEHNLWKHRVDANGKPKYRGWNQFVQEELEIVPSYSYRVMDVAANFSREQFVSIGVKKLTYLLGIGDQDRKELIARTRDEKLTAEQLADIVSKMNKSGKKPKGRTAAATQAAADKAAKRKEGQGVTAIVALGRQTVPLFARPSKANGKGKDEKPKHAKKIADDPHGQLELHNGVVMHFRLMMGAKGLNLVVETRRTES